MMQETVFGNPPIHNKYHLYMNGHGQRPVFSSKETKRDVVNIIATLSHVCGVKILAYHIMLTHLHIVMDGRQEDCRKYMGQFGRLLARYLEAKGIEYCPIRLDMDAVPDRDALLKIIVYVLRNGVDAGYGFLPGCSMDSPGNIYFVPLSQLEGEGRPISELSGNEQRRLFHSKVSLPQDWRYSDGMILPQSFVDWNQVNSIFKTVKTFMAFMNLRKTDVNEIDMAIHRRLIEDMSEKELRKMADERCRDLYGKKRSDCTLKEKMEIAKRLLSERAGYTLNQVSRALGVNREIVEVVFGHEV